MTTPQEPDGRPYYVEPPVAGMPYMAEPQPAPSYAAEPQPAPPYAAQPQMAQPQVFQPYQQYPPAYPPPGYGQQPPPYPYPYPPARSTNGMAVASMVLGIVWVYWIGSILALIFGYVALNEIRRSRQAGEGLAIAGIVLGWIGVGVLVIVLLMVATRGFS